MQTPRNLLILISDEHRRDAMGCAGHPIVKTPHLDALAARGTRFARAYTPSPMCVPTRAALATGRHVHQTGHWDSATPYAGAPASWMAHVREAGREVVSIGKLHFRSGEDDNGFSQERLPMHVVGGVGWAIGLLRDDPPAYDDAAELAADVGVGDSSYTEYDRQITADACAWLADPARRTGDGWVAFVSLVSPHYPLCAPEEFYGLYDPAEMDLPVAYDPAQRPTHPELQNLARFFDYDRYFDAEKMRQAKAAYYGLTSFMDDCVGQILGALSDSGQEGETGVLYLSDHGDMMGDHGFWTKQVMYEASAGVPMILAGPGVAQARVCETPVSLIDVAPTAMGLAGGAAAVAAQDLPGRSLFEIAGAPDQTGRTAFSEYHDGGSTTGAFMVRWDDWKYVAYARYPAQLFDLAADPHELRDLAPAASGDPRLQAAMVEGARRLAEICDPVAVDAACFAGQAARIAELGGREACRDAFVFNHTPTPAEQAKMSDG